MTKSNTHLGGYGHIGPMCEQLRKRASECPGETISAGHGAWSVAYSESEALGKIFSARAMRSTVERDWRVLGKIAEAIGAPDEPPSSIKTNPEVSHYWCWDTPDAVKGELAAMIRRVHGEQELV